MICTLMYIESKYKKKNFPRMKKVIQNVNRLTDWKLIQRVSHKFLTSTAII